MIERNNYNKTDKLVSGMNVASGILKSTILGIPLGQIIDGISTTGPVEK